MVKFFRVKREKTQSMLLMKRYITTDNTEYNNKCLWQ